MKEKGSLIEDTLVELEGGIGCVSSLVSGANIIVGWCWL